MYRLDHIKNGSVICNTCEITIAQTAEIQAISKNITYHLMCWLLVI